MSHPNRKAISKAFRLRGLSVRKEAVRKIESVLRKEEDGKQALDLILDGIKGRIDRAELTSGIVDVDEVKKVVASLSKNDDEVARDSIRVFSAFDTPEIRFNPSQKQFASVDSKRRRLHANAAAKIALYRDRFTVVRERVLRNAAFTPPLLGAASTKAVDYCQLTPIESLPSAVGKHYLLGMLTELEEGSLYLEDLNANVKLDLSTVVTSAGIFTDHCIVLVEGEMVDGVFHAQMMTHPPPESRWDSAQMMSGVEMLGIIPESPAHARLQKLENSRPNSMFVIISNVHIDLPEVMAKLRVLFEGFKSAPPTLFVFIGNFTSRPFGQGHDDAAELRRHFDALAALIAEFPTIVEASKFVFVPGPNDPGAASVLPRPPLPVAFTRRLRAVLPTADFTTNPCRIRYFTHEMVVFRENLLSKMRRHALIAPADGGDEDIDMTGHLVKTVIEQAHLCPLPLSVRPVYWSFDNALRLFPLPDLCILADEYDGYLQTYEDCVAVNPGPFPSDFSFLVYRPSTRETEFSRI